MNQDHVQPASSSVGPDDIWGSSSSGSSPGSANGGSSAFQEPDMVFDYDAGAAQSHANQPVEEAKPAGKSGPNYAILGVAAIIGLMVVGGGGYMGYKTFISQKSAPPVIASAPIEEASPAAPVAAPQSTGGVFDEKPASASASVFGTETSATTTSAATPVSGVDTASVSVEKAASAVVTEAAVTAATAVAAGSVSQARAADPATAAPAASPPETVPPKKSVASKPAQPKAAVAKTVAQTPSTQAGAASGSGAKVAKQKKPHVVAKASKKPLTPAAKTEHEINTDVRVVGVYPLTGKNAQAWLRSKQGATMVVRAGDVINGISILSVVPEKGLVKTSMGDLTSGGLAK